MRKLVAVQRIVVLILLAVPGMVSSQWYRQAFPSSEVLWKVRFVSPTTGWILGNRFVYKTRDGGLTWTAQDSSFAAGTAFRALDSATAFYANYLGISPYTRGIRRTVDGGATWQTVDTLKYLCNEIVFVDADTGYAGGGTIPDDHPLVRKTTDGGASWFTAWTGSGNYEIEGVSFFNAHVGWVVTYDAIVLETTNGGMSWTPQDTIRPPGFVLLPLRDITFASPDSGWAVGGIASLGNGAMLVARTTDGGKRWTYQTTTQAGSSLREVKFFDTKTGWFVGANNAVPFIAHTTDGGETWVTQDQIPYSIAGAESFSMVTKDIGWTVNNSAEVYMTTNGGTTFAPGDPATFPMHVELFQNYPNPFNPTTTISFTLPHAGKATLTVFNILGDEIATLFDEHLAGGTHTIRWDGTPFAAGVYYYRLQSNGSIETRKLILLK